MSAAGRTIRIVACFFLLSLILAVFLVPPAAAQVTTGSISGVITDKSGAVIPGAEITIRHLGTNVARTVLTNDAGLYVVADLQVGEYRIDVKMSGFTSVTKTGIVLTVGAAITQNFVLSVGSITEVVEVQAETAQLDTASSQLGALVDQRQMRDLPLNGRNFEQLILLAPGVQPVNTGQKTAFYGRAPSFSTSGARPEGEAILLDGTDIVNFWGHGTGASVLGTSLGVEAIAEFQTLTNTYSAEFGGSGSAINSVSKSGSNQVHGSAYDFLRNSAFDARNFFDPGKEPPTFRRNQFGGSLGGPIKKDTSFFFVNYEGLRQQLGLTGVTNVPNQAARNGDLPGRPHIDISNPIQELLKLYPVPNSTDNGDGTGRYIGVGNNTVNEDYVLARIDHRFNDRNSFFGRFVRDAGSYVDPFPVASRQGNIPGWPETDHAHNLYTTLEWKRTATTSLVNVVRYSYLRTNQGSSVPISHTILNVFPGEVRPDAIIAGTGFGAIGTGPTNPFYYVQNKHTLEDQAYWTRGNHDLRIGASAQRQLNNESMPLYAGSIWVFQSLEGLLTNRPFQLQGLMPGKGNARRLFNEWDFTAYVQDNWKLRPNFTLNLGVRYAPVTVAVAGDSNTILWTVIDPLKDSGFSPVDRVLGQNPSLKNIDPRIGLAYSPFSSSNTVIRAGFGLFHQLVAVRNYSGSFNTSPPLAQFAVQIPAPAFPNAFAGATPPLPSTQVAVPYNMTDNPYYTQWNLNIQQRISSGLSATIAYVGSRGNHLWVARDWNPVKAVMEPDGIRFLPAPGPGRPQERLNPLFGAMNQTSPEGISKYHALQLSLKGTVSKSFQVQAYYTWSKNLDNASNSTTSMSSNGSNQQTNPYDIKYDYGRSAYDIRHNFIANLIYDLPFNENGWVSGYQFSLISSIHSGPAYNVNTGYDSALVGNPLLLERPNLVGDPDQPGPVAANPGCVAPSQIHTAQAWYNPCAFAVPPAGKLGNLGRGALTGPASVNFDASLSKTTVVPQISEVFRIQFRFEVFNLFNRANFQLPNLNVFAAGGTRLGSAGTITSGTTTTSRQMQFSLKFLF